MSNTKQLKFPNVHHHQLQLPIAEKDLSPISFYMDVNYHITDNREKLIALLKHHFTNYVVGFEESKIASTPHAHIYTHAKPKNYQAFIAAVKNEWNLKGRATKNNRKQYGKIKKIIKSPDNMISYTIKSDNYEYLNYNKDYIRERKNDSYLVEHKAVDKYKIIVDIMKQEKANCPNNRMRHLERLIKEWSHAYSTIISSSNIVKVLYHAGLVPASEIAAQRGALYLNNAVNCPGSI